MGLQSKANAVSQSYKEEKQMKFEVIRYIDKLGRICIPIDVRRAMGVTEQSAIIIEVTEEGVLLRKKEGMVPVGIGANRKEYD